VATLPSVDREDARSPAPPRDGLARLATQATGMPLLAGSSFRLQCGAGPVLRSIIADIEAAQSNVEMQFCIWNAGGMEDEVALAVKPWKIPFRRIDLRLHRKIVVIDRRVGYTGSLSLVDPRFFKQDAGVGEWVDAMVRTEGPIVGALRTVLLLDWGMQTGQLPDTAAGDEPREAPLL
jgi:cardiolipin synthase